MTCRLSLAAFALVALTSLSAPAEAQCRKTYPVYRPCPTPAPVDPVYPEPAPPTAPSYFLGVTTSTIEVGVGVGSGVQVQVAPGYGEQALGQRINRIIPNSPAFHAGLEEGDVILNANGIPAESAEHLQAAVDGSEGYLEMQVVNGRDGSVVWVVAEPDVQSVGPLSAPARAAASRQAAPQRQAVSQRSAASSAPAPRRTSASPAQQGGTVRKAPQARRATTVSGAAKLTRQVIAAPSLRNVPQQAAKSLRTLVAPPSLRGK